MIVGGLMIAILALTLLALQQRFDQGDYERAVALLAAKAPGQAWSVNQELVQRAAADVVECQPQMESSIRGTLEVTCRLGKGEPYRFHVDLVRQQVQATDEHSRELLAAVAAKNASPPAADAGRP